jgi:hypothetical protein
MSAAGDPAPSGRRGGAWRLVDDRDDMVHGDRLALLRPDLGEDAGGGRGNLGIDLVGRDLEQGLVAVDAVADLLDPPDDGALGDRLAHLRHEDVGWHKDLSLAGPASGLGPQASGLRPQAC